MPISVSGGGFVMDVDRNVNIVSVLDGSNDKHLQFMRTSGMHSSALEHSVPEQMFSTPENPVQGISAVKALQIANNQGIPIYTINQSNINAIMPQLQVDDNVKADIQNAVNAGKEVSVSKTNITYNGWTGCGYIIIDPTTGAGAYMIGGGFNGAYLLMIAALISFLLPIVAIIIAGGGAAALTGAGILAAVGAWRYFEAVNKYAEQYGDNQLKLFNAILTRTIITVLSNSVGVKVGDIDKLWTSAFAIITQVLYDFCRDNILTPP